VLSKRVSGDQGSDKSGCQGALVDDRHHSIRRRFLTVVCGLLIIEPLFSSARAQAKVWRVGFLTPRRRPSSLESDIFGAFSSGMKDLGYVEGRNLVIEWRFANDRVEILPALATELVQSGVDVIVAAGSQATNAAQKAITKVPIVMGSVGDPVGAGFVKSLATPAGNITGLSNLAGDIGSKHLENLLLMMPRLSHVAVLANPDNSAHPTILKTVRAAAQRACVTITPLYARLPNELEHAFSVMREQHVGAVIAAADQFFRQQRHQIASLAKKHGIASTLPNRAFVVAGGLMSYGQNVADYYRRAAIFVDRILKGASPASLPVEQSTKFELVINRKTAKSLGLVIPQHLLIRADDVIE
jgi:putative ABC transport system substrate-binding protein